MLLSPYTCLKNPASTCGAGSSFRSLIVDRSPVLLISGPRLLSTLRNLSKLKRYLWFMASANKSSRKPKVSEEQMLRSLIASFSIEGIKLSIEEARDLLRKAKLSLGKQPG